MAVSPKVYPGVNIELLRLPDSNVRKNGKYLELVFMEPLSNGHSVPIGNITICFEASGR